MYLPCQSQIEPLLRRLLLELLVDYEYHTLRSLFEWTSPFPPRLIWHQQFEIG
jgi:hypothetical protein